MTDDVQTTPRPIKIVGIAGSLRRQSLNRGLLAAARELAPGGIDLQIRDLADIPMYNGDVEKKGIPEPVIRLAEAIANADALLVVTPEYNGGIPGVLKNALDWASRSSVGSPLRGKPVGIMGVSPGRFATARAQEQLKLTLLATKSNIFSGAGVALGQAADKFESGILVDPATREFVGSYLGRFAEWIRQDLEHQPVADKPTQTAPIA
ncbi:MAG: NAD(P)H-dependent oxidoreductase [Rhodothermales bacterium]|nr:NAD(P)H-dependent oxidoreductase [Rhodothermales bacterium]